MAGGNFYFVDQSAALMDIFVEEVKSFAFPIAENVHLSVSATSDFVLGDSVGFENFVSSASDGEVFFPRCSWRPHIFAVRIPMHAAAAVRHVRALRAFGGIILLPVGQAYDMTYTERKRRDRRSPAMVVPK